eukprot:GHVO01058181.1.p1 GENE.GHVO01058181.1~~GHVO01058181.1.p1  ORF type:complete len:140 (-),score=10.73 GHVO01058181.1:470-889(-)
MGTASHLLLGINCNWIQQLCFDRRKGWCVYDAIIHPSIAIFHALLDANAHKALNAILITGRGFPDFVTRQFIREVVSGHLQFPIYYIGDWDPSGILIYLTYSKGSSAFEGRSTACDKIKWIGIQNEGNADNVPNIYYQT